MSNEHPELDELQTNYKAAVEAWISSIRKEEALASVVHDVAEVDQWEKAHFEEDEMRTTVKAAKEKYEVRGRLARQVLWILAFESAQVQRSITDVSEYWITRFRG